MKQDYEIVLEHHGVKGMKWGVRKKYNQLERAGVSSLRKTALSESARDSNRRTANRAKTVGKTTEKILGKSNALSRGAYTYSQYKHKKANAADKNAKSEREKTKKYVEEASKLNPKIKLKPKVTQAIRLAKQVFMYNTNNPNRDVIFSINDKHAFRELVNEKQKSSR